MVRRTGTCATQLRTRGKAGSIGISVASTAASFFQFARSNSAWTDWPPTYRKDGATIATRKERPCIAVSAVDIAFCLLPRFPRQQIAVECFVSMLHLGDREIGLCECFAVAAEYTTHMRIFK